MALLEAFCLRESAGKITPALFQQLRAFHGDLVAARQRKDAVGAASLDGQFHLAMCRASGLPHTLHIIQNLFDRGEYYRIIMHARRGGFATESLKEHATILRAMERGDLDRTAKAIENHRLRAMRRLEETA